MFLPHVGGVGWAGVRGVGVGAVQNGAPML